MDYIDSKAFIKEREDKLGAPIIYKAFSLFFAQLGGEKRDYGVFLYSDGRTINIEDYERNPSILGISYEPRKKKEYKKFELSWRIDEIASVDLVTRQSADKSIKNGIDQTKCPSAIGKLVRKLITKITLTDGRIIFLEMMSHKEFVSFIEANKM